MTPPGLNDDVLIAVFVAFVERHQSPCTMPIFTAVCRRWREIAFATPELWKKMCCCVFLPYERQDLIISAMRGSAIDASFTAHSPGLVNALLAASGHVVRMKTIHIKIRSLDVERSEDDPDGAIEDYADVLTDMMTLTSTELECFSLLWDSGGFDFERTPIMDLQTFNSPNLKRLRLSGIRLRRIDLQKTAFKRLTLLSLSDLRHISSIGPADIIELAASLECLESLALDATLDWTYTRNIPTCTLSKLRILLLRDDIENIANVMKAIECPNLETMRIWATSPHYESSAVTARATVSIMRSSPVRAASPMLTAQALTIVFKDSDRISIGWSTGDMPELRRWIGVGRRDARPPSLDREHNLILSGNRRNLYTTVIHIVSDQVAPSSSNPGILTAESVIRQFSTSLRNPRELRTFSAQGLSFALSEYIQGTRAASIYIDQNDQPMHDWSATIPFSAFHKTSSIHICRAVLTDITVDRLTRLQNVVQVTMTECNTLPTARK